MTENGMWNFGHYVLKSCSFTYKYISGGDTSDAFVTFKWKILSTNNIFIIQYNASVIKIIKILPH